MTAPPCPSCNARKYTYDEISRIDLGEFMQRIYFLASCDSCGFEEKLSTEAHSLYDSHGPSSTHESARNSAARRKMQPAKCRHCGYEGRAVDPKWYECGVCYAKQRAWKHQKAAEKFRARAIELQTIRQNARQKAK